MPCPEATAIATLLPMEVLMAVAEETEAVLGAVLGAAGGATAVAAAMMEAAAPPPGTVFTDQTSAKIWPQLHGCRWRRTVRHHA